jgi:arabinoxylan arabinofuranohydrolase
MKVLPYTILLHLHLLCAAPVALPAQTVAGRFTNPILYADIPDPDIIRVGGDYYMISTTMHLMPGAPIMHSKDLIHWQIIRYVFDELKDSPSYDLEGGSVYGQGQWASSLRHRPSPPPAAVAAAAQRVPPLPHSADDPPPTPQAVGAAQCVPSLPRSADEPPRLAQAVGAAQCVPSMPHSADEPPPTVQAGAAAQCVPSLPRSANEPPRLAQAVVTGWCVPSKPRSAGEPSRLAQAGAAAQCVTSLPNGADDPPPTPQAGDTARCEPPLPHSASDPPPTAQAGDAGRFYVFFATNRPQKSYIYAADDPAGRWERVCRFDRVYHDASLLFDDDGRVYLSHVEGKQIRIVELRSDLAGLRTGGLDAGVIDAVAQGYDGLFEGTHLYRIDGKYYIFIIWWPRGGIRTQLCFRSDRIEGPYESRTILSDTLDLHGRGVAQGGIVDTEDGRWFGFLFQDRNAVGRVPVLTPCRWEDGWPMLGDRDGKAPAVMDNPLPDYPQTSPVVSDDFETPTLSLAWQWNHNPDNRLWSLTERPGYMRLRTGKTVKSLFEARNTLSQRTEGPQCSGTASLDVSHMKEGDTAGLGAFCAEPGLLSVVMEADGRKSVVMTDRGVEKGRFALHSDTVYLRMDCDFRTDRATFYYRPADHAAWVQVGGEFQMIYNLVHFMGNRFALYNYATKTSGGYVDIDFFHYNK